MSKDTELYASGVRRIGAYAIDAVVLFLAFPLILGAICSLIFYFTIGVDWMRNGFLFWGYIFLTVSIPFWLYYSVLESSQRQATIGMRVLGLQVTDTEGRRITRGRALLRTVVKLLPFEVNHMVLFLPVPIWRDPHPGFRVGFIIVDALIVLYFVSMFLTRRRQSVHDIVAGTVVVNAR